MRTAVTVVIDLRQEISTHIKKHIVPQSTTIIISQFFLTQAHAFIHLKSNFSVMDTVYNWVLWPKLNV